MFTKVSKVSFESKRQGVTLDRTEVNNERTLCVLKVGTVEKAKSLSDL